MVCQREKYRRLSPSKPAFGTRLSEFAITEIELDLSISQVSQNPHVLADSKFKNKKLEMF
jgi:hypothetical protein